MSGSFWNCSPSNSSVLCVSFMVAFSPRGSCQDCVANHLCLQSFFLPGSGVVQDVQLGKLVQLGPKGQAQKTLWGPPWISFVFWSFWFDVVFYYAGLLDLIYVLVHVGLCCRKPHGGGRTTMEMKTSPGQSGMRAGGGSGRMSRSKKPCDEFQRKKLQRKKLQEEAEQWDDVTAEVAAAEDQATAEREEIESFTKFLEEMEAAADGATWFHFILRHHSKTCLAVKVFLENSCIQSLLFADLTCLFFIFPTSAMRGSLRCV